MVAYLKHVNAVHSSVCDNRGREVAISSHSGLTIDAHENESRVVVGGRNRRNLKAACAYRSLITCAYLESIRVKFIGQTHALHCDSGRSTGLVQDRHKIRSNVFRGFVALVVRVIRLLGVLNFVVFV